jgi:hypothetical protein
MANRAGESAEQIERFIRERRARGEEAWCPLHRAVISKRACVERHLRDHTSRWFGRETDALATPQDKACNACGLGRLYSQRLGAKGGRKRAARRRGNPP